MKLNYIRNYKNHVREGFGKKKIMDIRYTDVKIFYHVDKDLSVSTVENIHNAIHPAFNMAIRDQLLIRNPTDDIMAEIKSGKGFKLPEKRIALTIPEQKSFMEFLYNDKEYKGWYPIIAVLIGTGMRISEYFILPSSVHEVLIVPKNDQMDLKTLESMVQDVNATQVSPEERLSDHVYAYDAKEHELFRADKAEERAAAKEAEASKETAVEKTSAKEEKKQERPSLKERLAQKKDIVAKNEATREPRQMNKDRGQALA